MTMALHRELDDYLAIRRSFGFKLERAEKLLRQFLAYLEATNEDHVSVKTALAWARLPEGSQGWWAMRCRWCGSSPATCTPSTPATR
jgi:hypothetical protein